MLNIIFEARLGNIPHTAQKDKEFLQANSNFGDIHTILESLIHKSCGNETNYILQIKEST